MTVTVKIRKGPFNVILDPPRCSYSWLLTNGMTYEATVDGERPCRIKVWLPDQHVWVGGERDFAVHHEAVSTVEQWLLDYANGRLPDVHA